MTPVLVLKKDQVLKVWGKVVQAQESGENVRGFQVSWSERSRRCQEGVAGPEDGETGTLGSDRASFITLEAYTSSCTIEFRSQCFSDLFEDDGRDDCLKKDGFKGQ